MSTDNPPHRPTEAHEADPLASSSSVRPAGGAGSEIAVLSADPALRELLRGISIQAMAMNFVDDWAALRADLDQQRCNIVLLDADQIEPSRLDAHIDELGRLLVSPVIIAAASGERAKECMERLDGGQVHRLLLKPATLGATRRTIDYAISRSRQVRPSPLVPLKKHSALPAGWIAAGAVAVLALAMTGIGMLRQPPAGPPVEESQVLIMPSVPPEPEPALIAPPVLTQAPAEETDAVDRLPDDPLIEDAAPPAEPEERALVDLETTPSEEIEPEEPLAEPEVVEAVAAEVAPVEPAPVETEAPDPAPAEPFAAPAQPREIDRLLAESESRLQAGELIRPPGADAISYYLSAASIDAADPQVLDLHSRLSEGLVVAAQQALQAGDVQELEMLIGSGRELGANAAVFDDLEAQLQAAEAQQAAQHQLERESELLNAGLERMRAQQFFSPDGDSAVFYLAQLRAANPDHPGLAAPWTELIRVAAEQTSVATTAGELDMAEGWIGWLERLEADPTFIEPLALALASARRQDEFLRVPAGPTEMDLLHFEPAVFPSRALQRNREGWVDIDFIVGRDGVPRDIQIAVAEPAGLFERSAITAVGRYRYAPFVYNGNVYERRVELRLLFEIN